LQATANGIAKSLLNQEFPYYAFPTSGQLPLSAPASLRHLAPFHSPLKELWTIETTLWGRVWQHSISITCKVRHVILFELTTWHVESKLFRFP